MQIQDFGTISGEILIFGGIYSNLPALEQVIALAKARGIPASNMICTGDIVAYCADAQACVESIRALDCPVLAGNCEQQLAQNAPDCGCGFEDGSTCSLLSVAWYNHASKEVSLKNKAWMGALPERIVFTHEGTRYGVVHGGASDISKFVWPVSRDAELGAEINKLQHQVGQVDCVLAGHTGIAMDRIVDGVRWVNSGAVGMPPNDGDARGAFAVIRGNFVSFERFAYDNETTKTSKERAGLIQGYHTCIKSGYWPSEDTLPPEMRVQSSAIG